MEFPIDDLDNKINAPGRVNYAGFWLRFLAVIIDAVVLNIASTFITTPLLKLMGIYLTDKIDPQQREEIARTMQENPNVSISQLLQQLFNVTPQQLMIVFSVAALVNWLYYALMESSPKKATLGKMALGIQVTDMHGEQISFLKATIRHFSKYLSAVILLIGYVMAGLTEKKQALHDLIAGCLVSRSRN